METLGSNTIHKLIVGVCLVLLAAAMPGPAMAQGPAPTPDIPYHFEPLEIPPAEHTVPVNVVDTNFISDVGSYALTLFKILDDQSVLGNFVVIMVGLWCVWWIYRYVSRRPTTPGKVESDGGHAHRGRKRYY